MRILGLFLFILVMLPLKLMACELQTDFKIQDSYVVNILKELQILIPENVKNNIQPSAHQVSNPLINFQHALNTIEPYLSGCNRPVRKLFQKLTFLESDLKKLALIPSEIIFISTHPEFLPQVEKLQLQLREMLKMTPATLGQRNSGYKIFINFEKVDRDDKEKIRYLKSSGDSIYYSYYLKTIKTEEFANYQNIMNDLTALRLQFPFRFKRNLPFKKLHFLMVPIDFISFRKLKDISQIALFLIFLPALFYGFFRHLKDWRNSQSVTR